MRELKFRVWDSKESEMVSDPQATEILLRHNMGLFCKPNSAYKPSELKVMQYTGLLDKNGKEIYEGDIVEFGGLGIVKYDEDRYYVDCGTVHTRVSKLHEVVGNIHEDSKLLIN